jgi:glucose repression regulatory protein TUP1
MQAIQPTPTTSSQDKKQSQQSSGWLAIYSLPEQQRAVAVDLLSTMSTEHVICSVSFSHDGRLLAVGTNRAVCLFEVATGKRVAVLIDTGVESTGRDSTDLYMRSVQWSEDDGLLAAGAEDHYVRVWTVSSQRLKHRLAGHGQDVYAVAFLPAPSRCLVSASGDRTIKLWDVNTGECKCTLSAPDMKEHFGFTSLAVSGGLLVAGSLDRLIRIWRFTGNDSSDYSSWTLDCVLEGHQDAVYSVALSQAQFFDSEKKPLLLIASSSLDGTVKLWKQQQKQDPSSSISFSLIDTLSNHKDYCLSVSISPDARLLSSASKDRSINIYTLDYTSTGTGGAVLQCSVQGHRNSVIACSFAGGAGEGGSLLLASGSGDCRARLWRVDQLRQ